MHTSKTISILPHTPVDRVSLLPLLTSPAPPSLCDVWGGEEGSSLQPPKRKKKKQQRQHDRASPLRNTVRRLCGLPIATSSRRFGFSTSKLPLPSVTKAYALMHSKVAMHGLQGGVRKRPPGREWVARDGELQETKEGKDGLFSLIILILTLFFTRRV